MDQIDRINYALDKSNITRQALAEWLGLGRGAVSARLNNKESEFDSLKYLEATAELTGFSFEWLRTGKGPERVNETLSTANEPALPYGELERLKAENEKLKFEIEILRSALREIGVGHKGKGRTHD